MAKHNNGNCDLTNISKNLIVLRKKHGLSRKEVAKNLDVSLRTVYDWEGGLKFPKLINLLQSDLERVKEIAKKKDTEYASLEEQKNAILNELNELKDIKLSSMDEKINQIILALKNQTELLDKVNSTLKETNKILATRNFSGRNIVRR